MHGYGNYPVYQGRRYQQSGSGFFSAALPFLKSLGLRVAKTALQEAPGMIVDVIDKKRSAKDAGLGFLKTVGMSAARGAMGGAGRRKKSVPRKRILRGVRSNTVGGGSGRVAKTRRRRRKATKKNGGRKKKNGGKRKKKRSHRKRNDFFS